MILKKYSVGSGKTSTGSSSSGSSSSSSSAAQQRISREIWGQHDDGSDIDGDAVMQGNIYAVTADWSDEDSDDDSKLKEEPEKRPLEDIFDEDSGNIYAEKNIKAGGNLSAGGDIKASMNVSAGGNVSAKGNVSADKDISAGANISAKGNVSADGNISASKEVMGAELYATSAIFLPHPDTGVKTNIIDLIRELASGGSKYGSAKQPVVLLSGMVYRSGSVWMFEGSYLPCVSYVTVNDSDGLLILLLHLEPAECSGLEICAVNVTQQTSGDTQMVTETLRSGEGEGAHWFEARTKADPAVAAIYIREFHQTADSESSWASDSWTGDHSVDAVNVAAFGYAKPV